MAAVTTTLGAAKIAAATASQPLDLSHIAIGDGNGSLVNPSPNMTALVNERVRLSVVDKIVTGNTARFRAVFMPGPSRIIIREAGLFASDGTLVRIADWPEQVLPASSEGYPTEIEVTLALVVSDANALSITVNPSATFATVQYVDGKVPPFATIPEHKAGNTAAKMVHPTGLKAVMDDHKASRSDHPSASTLEQGFVRLATPEETAAGESDSIAVTPAGLDAVLDVLKGNVSPGYNTLKEIEDAVVALITGQTQLSQLVANAAVRDSAPFFPEVLNSQGQIPVVVSGSTVVVDAATEFLHRGGRKFSTASFSLAQRTFATVASKTYHLRWRAPGHVDAPSGTWPFGRLMLLDLSSVGYNPGALAESDVAFDTAYDDMLIARVITSSGNVPTAVTLVNRTRLAMTAEKTQHNLQAGGWGGLPALQTNQNWSRRPRIALTAMSCEATTSTENIVAVSTSRTRYSAAVMVQGYIISEGHPTPYISGTCTVEMEA